jgi:hypothetical protein
MPPLGRFLATRTYEAPTSRSAEPCSWRGSSLRTRRRVFLDAGGHRLLHTGGLGVPDHNVASIRVRAGMYPDGWAVEVQLDDLDGGRAGAEADQERGAGCEQRLGRPSRTPPSAPDDMWAGHEPGSSWSARGLQR